ncbi:hypothetical protein CHLNCDRAFT_145336 [Chlorella variabilis]|uniref:Galectin domain-containing protein n=1 Tax=Chlorella variabilis TaxID=554065 RepID=E1ZE73_CHLVA|nr:hypothetical protein CHLNCDRAFT_145336 [Chlorella variabilis]EFN55980.1 hypothetical protein CHLNCDRAFT_145336 [Chlorella variabilis]|eukprot:XP_005848082.1 hypothetical protein CHLNCDRAFT_145336 [Chlorella variabilis]
MPQHRWDDDDDPEALSSPTAKKLHQRHSPTAAMAARARIALLGLRGRRMRLAAAAATALLVLLVCMAQRAAGPHLPTGFPGGESQAASRLPQAKHLGVPLSGPVGSHGSGLPGALAGVLGTGRGSGDVLVEFTAPGLFVPLSQALDGSHAEWPEEAPLIEAVPLRELSPPELVAFGGRPTLEQVLRQRQQQQQATSDGSPSVAATGGGVPASIAALAGGPTRGQTSADLANQIQSELQQAEEASQRAKREKEEATAKPQASVAAARGEATEESYQAATAALFQRAQGRQMLQQQLAQAHYPNIDLRFFLAQPASAELAAEWLPQLQEDLAHSNDIVVLRGPDTYLNLPNKTLRLMRYALAHPAVYTHVLKTDDDCYIRIGNVMEALVDDAPEQHASATAAPGAHGPRRLPALNRALREQMARDGSPLHSDGISLYNATRLVASAGSAAGRKYLDDAEGRPISLEQLAKDAVAAARQHQEQLQADKPARAGRPAGSTDGVQQEQQQQHAAASLAAPAGLVVEPTPRMHGVYLGCLENRGGFFPIRDPNSKWHMSDEELPDSAVPFAVKYLAGWGYVLSRDLVDHAVRKANLFRSRPEVAPPWFRPMAWEDVLMALLLMDVVAEPQDHPGFRAAWRACPSTTALKHLDVDAPQLFRGLYEQEMSGLWDAKPVQCSAGDFLPGDYSSWKAWRDSLPTVAHI